MTRDEFEKILKDNHFYHIIAWPGDKLSNLIEGIYYDGMRDGYQVAIDRLTEFQDYMPSSMPRIYWEKHEEQINNIIDAIREYKESNN